MKSPKLYLKIWYVIFFDEKEDAKRIFKNLEVNAFFSNDQKFWYVSILINLYVLIKTFEEFWIFNIL